MATPEGSRPSPYAVEGSTNPNAQAVSVSDPYNKQQTGTWSYYSGASGTVTVSAGQRVAGISAHATTAGSMTIAGGSSIPIPAGIVVNINPAGNVTAPTIVFTGTDMYVVEVVQ